MGKSSEEYEGLYAKCLTPMGKYHPSPKRDGKSRMDQTCVAESLVELRALSPLASMRVPL